MLTLYDNLLSGNGYKVRLLLSQLQVPFLYAERDVFAGETRRSDFLAINPNGRIPAVVFDDGRVLCESGAILYYFAQATAYLPQDDFARAETLQWMFFEQYSHEPYIAVARFWLHLDDGRERFGDQLAEKWEKGHAALQVMEGHLGQNDFFAGGAYSIADIALYAYSHVAGEGDFDLSPYPNLRAWLARIANQPGHIPITKDDFPRAST